MQKQKKSNFSSLFVVGVIGLVATWLLLWKGVPVIVPIIVHPRSNEPQRRPLPPSRRAPASCFGTKRNPVQSGGKVLGAFSSLCLRLFYPGDRGVGGRGSHPDGPTFKINLARPARAIRDGHHNLGLCGYRDIPSLRREGSSKRSCTCPILSDAPHLAIYSCRIHLIGGIIPTR